MSTSRITPARLVNGVVAGMVTAVAAATAAGFWLSYGGLHDFAVRAGLHGAEGWAWPATLDLFIAAGEAGVTISALRRQKDKGAWCYLVLGFAASVTGNALHADMAHLAWTRYAVAVTPPIAAMLALAALLRHVYRLALDAHLARAQEDAPEVARKPWWRFWAEPATPPAEGQPAVLPSAAEPVTLPSPARLPREAPAREAAPQKAARPSDAERVAHLRALLEDGRSLTIDAAMEELKAGRPVAKRILEAAMAPNGSGPGHE